MSTAQPRPKRQSNRGDATQDSQTPHSTSAIEVGRPPSTNPDDTELPKRRARRRGKRGGGSARRKNAARAAALGDHPPSNSDAGNSVSASSQAVRSGKPDATSELDAGSQFATPAPFTSSSSFTPRPFPPTENAWHTRHGCATTSPINPVFDKGVDGLVPSETEAARAPSSLKSPVSLYHTPIHLNLTPSSTTSHDIAPPSRAFVGNHFPIPVDSLPTTKPFSLETPRFSDAQIGVPTAYNAEYPHPLTAYASPAVNPSTVSSSRYDVLLDELLASDPDAAMGSTLANSGKEGIGPPALSLHADSKDGCGIPENLWLQLTTWDSVKVPVGTVVPKAHPSRFTPGPRLSAMIDRSRRVLPPTAGRRPSTSEPPSSPDVSTLRRSLSTGNLDTFLRSWSELATATTMTGGRRRAGSLVASERPSPFQREHITFQSPFDFAPTPHLRPRMSLPINILSPVAEEEGASSPLTAVVERSPFPSPFNYGVMLADVDPARDPTEFIPSVFDEPRDPDPGHLPDTPLTPPLDWPMPRYEEKPPVSRPDHLDDLEHTHHIFLPAGLLPPEDEWAPLATTTLDFSTGNSIWA